MSTMLFHKYGSWPTPENPTTLKPCSEKKLRNGRSAPKLDVPTVPQRRVV
jgi:hypothetical protein